MSTNSADATAASTISLDCHKEILTCKVAVLYKNIMDSFKRTHMQIFSVSKRRGPFRTHSSKFNFISVALLFFVFVSIVPCTKADYLCGSRLVDALRYICGERGIHNPVHSNRYRGTPSRRRQPQMSITQLCCEVGCTMTQLKGYCAPKRQRFSHYRHHRYQQHSFPTPPHFVAPPTPSLLQRVTTQSQQVETTRYVAPPTESTITTTLTILKTTRPTLKELESQYRSLIKEDEHDRASAAGSTRRNRVPEIIRIAAEISRRMNKESPKIISPHGGHVKATLVLEE